MIKMLRSLVLTSLVALALLAGVIPAAAQTTVSSTTFSAAVVVDQQIVTVASATGIDVGDLLFADREVFEVTAVSGTNITVRRGTRGTGAREHASGVIVYLGLPSNFYSNEVVPGSTCTSTAELFLPRIVIPSGNIYQCTGSVWQQLGYEIGTVVAQFQQGGVVANAVDTIFFIADRDYRVSKITAVWAVAETTGSMDIMVEKLTGTTACASGTDVMSAAIAGTGTANTVNTASLSTTTTSLELAAGNRLCVDLTVTPNEVSQMTVTVTLAPR